MDMFIIQRRNSVITRLLRWGSRKGVAAAAAYVLVILCRTTHTAPALSQPQLIEIDFDSHGRVVSQPTLKYYYYCKSSIQNSSSSSSSSLVCSLWLMRSEG